MPKVFKKVKPGPVENGDELRREYADWLIDPDRQGTKGAWAEAHGVTSATLSHWKKHPDVVARLGAYRALLRPDFVEATATMVGRAKRGDVAAYVAVARVLGENAPEKIDAQVSDRRISYAPPDALREYVAQLDAREGKTN